MADLAKKQGGKENYVSMIILSQIFINDCSMNRERVESYMNVKFNGAGQGNRTLYLIVGNDSLYQ